MSSGLPAALPTGSLAASPPGPGGTGTVTVTPPAGGTGGVVVVTVTATDGAGASASTSFTVTVVVPPVLPGEVKYAGPPPEPMPMGLASLAFSYPGAAFPPQC